MYIAMYRTIGSKSSIYVIFIILNNLNEFRDRNLN